MLINMCVSPFKHLYYMCACVVLLLCHSWCIEVFDGLRVSACVCILLEHSLYDDSWKLIVLGDSSLDRQLQYLPRTLCVFVYEWIFLKPITSYAFLIQ